MRLQTPDFSIDGSEFTPLADIVGVEQWAGSVKTWDTLNHMLSGNTV